MSQVNASNQTLNLWQGLDRLAFCENAILLELRSKSQGRTITSSKVNEQQCEPRLSSDLLCEAFLDDIALIASGEGGRDNVAATCLERNAVEPSSFVIRVARNEGFDEDVLGRLQEIVNMAKCR